jgi:hypothetical protein
MIVIFNHLFLPSSLLRFLPFVELVSLNFSYTQAASMD